MSAYPCGEVNTEKGGNLFRFPPGITSVWGGVASTSEASLDRRTRLAVSQSFGQPNARYLRFSECVPNTCASLAQKGRQPHSEVTVTALVPSPDSMSRAKSLAQCRSP